MKTEAMKYKQFGIAPNKIKTLKAAIVGFVSYVAVGANILGTFSPFGVALVGGLPMTYSYIAYIGSVFALIFNGIVRQDIIYIITLTTIIVLKKMFSAGNPKYRQLKFAWITFLVVATINTLAYFILALTVTDFIFGICESIIASSLAYIIYVGGDGVLSSGKIKSYDSTEKISLIILLMILTISLLTVNYMGLNIGIIFSLICLMFTVQKYKAEGGAIAGVILGFTYCLYSADFLPISAIIVTAAFISGLFAQIGRLPQVAMMLAVSVFSSFIIGINIDMLFSLTNIIIASTFYLAFPKKIMEVFLKLDERKIHDNDIKGNIGSKLSFAASTIEDLQNSIRLVSDKLSHLSYTDVETVYNKTAGNVCKNCGLNMMCWEEQYNDTMEGFDKILGEIRKKGVISVKEVSDKKIINCCRPDALIENITKNYTDFLFSQNDKRQKTHARKLAVEQLVGVSHLLTEVSDEISTITQNDKNAAQVVRGVFESFSNIKENIEVYCTINKYERMEIDIYLQSNVEIESTFIDVLSHQLKRNFASPCISKTESKVKISIYEKATYIPDFSAYQKNSLKDNYCGDSYDSFLDSKGNFYIVLSDGMGTGKRAALDSVMTCSIVMKLIKAGLGLDSIIKFVNSSLQAKSTEESLSTIDIAKVDLYTGEVDFYKAGSADSFAIVDNTFAKINANSLPVGILEGVEFEHKSITLKVDDILLLVSDGALIEDKKMSFYLKQARQGDAKDIAEELFQMISREKEIDDDLSILVLKLNKGV